jgi:hypothetical protein
MQLYPNHNNKLVEAIIIKLSVGLLKLAIQASEKTIF